MKIGYHITAGGIVLNSSSPSLANLITLGNTNDSSNSDFVLDLVFANKNKQYDYQCVVGDPCTANVYLLNDDGTLLKEFNLFSGAVMLSDWNFKTGHVIAHGDDNDMRATAVIKERVYEQVNSQSYWKKIIKDIIDDYNEVAQSRLKGPEMYGFMKNNRVDHFEVSQNETYETVINEIMRNIGGVCFAEPNKDGTSTLKVLLGQASTGEYTEMGSYSKFIYDSVAVNELGYVNRITVHGSPRPFYDVDRNVLGTTQIEGSFPVGNANNKGVHAIEVNDPNCHTEADCIARAANLYLQGANRVNSIKPIITNIAPRLGSLLKLVDERTGSTATGIVQRREITLDASQGMLCQVEVALGTSNAQREYIKQAATLVGESQGKGAY